MNWVLGAVIASVLGLGVVSQKGCGKTSEVQRYVVHGDLRTMDVGVVAKTLEQRGSIVVKQLKYTSGLVAYMTKEEAVRLATDSNLVVEPDVKLGVMGKPSMRPSSFGCNREEPVPPPPPPISDQINTWGIQSVRANRVWSEYRGRDVIVCVADTGVDDTHEDLRGQIRGGISFVGGTYLDRNGHGTHVAGTIAASDNSFGVVGVAPEAQIFVAKVLDDDGSGFISDIADGIRGCVDNGADVINLSLGGGGPTIAIREALQYAQQNGVLSVCAAGNDAGPVNYPAAHQECIAISAIDKTDQLAYFSSRGFEVEYTAPGVEVLSTTPGDRYSYFDGTSMATPHAAGVMALMLEAGKQTPGSIDLGLPITYQGLGLIDAVGSTQ